MGIPSNWLPWYWIVGLAAVWYAWSRNQAYRKSFNLNKRDWYGGIASSFYQLDLRTTENMSLDTAKIAQEIETETCFEAKKLLYFSHDIATAIKIVEEHIENIANGYGIDGSPISIDEANFKKYNVRAAENILLELAKRANKGRIANWWWVNKQETGEVMLMFLIFGSLVLITKLFSIFLKIL